MILVSGHKGTGKSTVGKILEEENFLVIDTGLHWRAMRDAIEPSISLPLFREQMAQKLGSAWEEEHLASVLITEYPPEAQQRYKDLVIIGYRNYERATHLAGLLKDKIYPNRETCLIYLKCDAETALNRLSPRERGHSSLAELLRKYDEENDRGLQLLEQNSQWVIENNGSIPALRVLTEEIIYEHLGYSRTSIEGNTSRSKEME